MNTQHLLTPFDLTPEKAQELVSSALRGAHDGDLFLESSRSQSLHLEDGHVKNASYSDSAGFGLRRIDDANCALVHSSILSKDRLVDASKQLASLAGEDANVAMAAPRQHAQSFYQPIDVVTEFETTQYIELLQKIDLYLRQKSNLVKQVVANIALNVREILIIRADGPMTSDIQPMVRLNVSVMVTNAEGRSEMASDGFGGRYSAADLLNQESWQNLADSVLKKAEVQLEAIQAPGGEMPVIMANGWSGVLFHEAVGHGLEGDFNRKGNSAFSGRIGEKVAPECVTVIDDGTMESRRGSINVDDEGTPSQRNVLIENGILKKYMQDRTNARLMGVEPTGNGRRENYAYNALPRMTNTFLDAGQDTEEEMLKGIDKGLYCQSFGGGQVDITSGNYVFVVNEAFLIENGQKTAPVKGATLIGHGPTSLQFIDKVGADLALDPGVGTCGKAGQSVPAGVGMPTIRLTGGLTVGGTS
jgi:TldD protein